MTTQQILSLARKKLLELQDEIVEDSTLLIYANLTHEDVVKRSFPNNAIVSDTVTFVDGVGDLPVNFGTLYSDALDANGNVFPEVSIADFGRLNSGNGITVSGGQLKASPISTTSLTINYYPTYPTLTADIDPQIDSYLHEPIVYGIIARAFEDLQDPELSLFYENKYEKMLTEKLSKLSAYEENAQHGGTMFNPISIINNNGYSNPDSW